MRRLALAVVVLCTLGGCALLAELLQETFEKPKLTFKTARVSQVTLESLTLDTVWRLDNPNSVGVSLARADYRLFVEGKPVVAGQPPLGLTIPANGSTELVFPATVRFADVLPVAQELATRDFMHYRVEGTVGVDTPLGVLDFPLAYEGQLEVPKVPKLELQQPRITHLGLNGASIEFPLSITNRNGFTWPLEGVSGRLSVGGSVIGNVSTGNVGALEPHATKVVTLPVNVDLISAAGAVARALQGGREEVRFEAQLQSGGKSVPVDVSQVLQFLR